MATEGTILRLDKLAIIEDASPDNVVTLTPVTEGVDGSAVFGVSSEAGEITLGAGQVYIDRVNPELSVICIKPDTADVTQIESWVDNRTDVYLSGVTLDGGILVGDRQTATAPIKLLANEELTDNDVYAFNVQKQATPGFDPSTGIYQDGFWIGKNLIGVYQWGDNDSDGIADGYQINNANATSFSSGQQTIEATTTTASMFREIWFPFEGRQITFSIDIDSRSGTYSIEEIEIIYLDSSNSSISTTTQAVNSTGRKSVTSTTPTGSDLSVVRVQLQIQASSGTVTSVVSDPALKLGTESTYSKF